MKGKLIINHSSMTITLASDIVIPPNSSIKITMAQYYEIYNSPTFINYLQIGYIVCYDTTLPKKVEKVEETIQDNRLNTAKSNTIIKEDNTTNNVNVSVSETKDNTNVAKVKEEVVKTVEPEPKAETEKVEETVKPKTTPKKRSGRKKKTASK